MYRDPSSQLSSKLLGLKLQEAAPPVTLSEDIVAVVMRSVDMSTALKCRVVCKAWKKIVQDAGLHPIEAGKKGEDLDAGNPNVHRWWQRMGI